MIPSSNDETLYYVRRLLLTQASEFLFYFTFLSSFSPYRAAYCLETSDSLRSKRARQGKDRTGEENGTDDTIRKVMSIMGMNKEN
jgi:hypothetical protein